MIRLRVTTLSLMLSIVLWGTLLGGIAYSHIVFFPVYLSGLPDSTVLVNGRFGISDASFWFVIHPLLILSLIATLILNWRLKTRFFLILLSFAVYFVLLVITQLSFVPELRAFKDSALTNVPAAEWIVRGQRWQHLSWVRGALCYLAFLPLLYALTKPDTSMTTAPSIKED